MGTFLLIHGACHDGWYWRGVADLLEEKGHRVVAPDLPCEDPEAGIAEYSKVAADAVGPHYEAPLVVVGHSLGALTAAMVASQLDTHRLVFVSGIIGKPGKSLENLVDVDAARDGPFADGDLEFDDLSRFRFTESGARRVLYHDCSPAVIAEACAHLRFQRSLWTERLAIDDWPDVSIASIVCRDDRVVNPEWSRRVSRQRLGVDPIEIASGHTPMLSRPNDIAEALLTG